MSYKKLLLATACFATLCANAASASEVYARKTLNLRAGPDKQYPVVERVRSGSVLQVFGCIDGYRWCDVGFAEDRGWVSASYLQTIYEDRPVQLIEIGPVIHIPLIRYDVRPYWDEHYRSKPFYHDVEHWSHDDHHAEVHNEHVEHVEYGHPDEHANDHSWEDHNHGNGDDHGHHH